jgi:squalene-hopene/tetraprenyl-beta-curcumene cyclase
LVANAELFVYRRAAPESIIDAAAQGHVPVAKSAETAREMLDQPGASLDADKRKALEFLANAKRDSVRAPSRVRASGQRATQSGIGPFTYDDLLPFVYLDLSPDHTIALRALEALRTYYALDHNPDLTKRYGPGGFQPGTQGLFYYYLVVARALSTYGVKTIQTADGAKHEWAREISSKLLELQRPDGSWVNQDARWWEHEPALVTSYALLTLSRCRASLAAPDPAKR